MNRLNALCMYILVGFTAAAWFAIGPTFAFVVAVFLGLPSVLVYLILSVAASEGEE